MKATFLKYSKKPSNFGGFFYYIFVKGEDGKSYRGCIGDGFINFGKWNRILATAERGDILENLRLKEYKGKPIIDADSNVVLKKLDMPGFEGTYEQLNNLKIR